MRSDYLHVYSSINTLDIANRSTAVLPLSSSADLCRQSQYHCAAGVFSRPDIAMCHVSRVTCAIGENITGSGKPVNLLRRTRAGLWHCDLHLPLSDFQESPT